MNQNERLIVERVKEALKKQDSEQQSPKTGNKNNLDTNFLKGVLEGIVDWNSLKGYLNIHVKDIDVGGVTLEFRICDGSGLTIGSFWEGYIHVGSAVQIMDIAETFKITFS